MIIRESGRKEEAMYPWQYRTEVDLYQVYGLSALYDPQNENELIAFNYIARSMNLCKSVAASINSGKVVKLPHKRL